MVFRTDYVYCPNPKVGRRHSVVCHLRCKDAEWCKPLKEHDRLQFRLIDRVRQENVLPAYQRLLPGWVNQEWPELKVKEEKKKEENKTEERKEEDRDGE